MLTSDSRLKKLYNYLRFQRGVNIVYLPKALAQESVEPVAKTEVAILLSPGATITPQEKMKIADGVAWIFDATKADLVILNEASPDTVYRFVYDGVAVLVRSEAERIEFESHALSHYLDTNCLKDFFVKPTGGFSEEVTYGHE